MARPTAPRFEMTVLKDKSPTDPTQVLATDATIHFYRQGATVKTQVTLPIQQDVPVSVHDTGELVLGDLVRFDDSADTLVVMGLSPGIVTLRNLLSGTISLAAHTRLRPTGNRPDVYADPLAMQPLGPSIAVDTVTARASAYLSRDRVDFEVAVPSRPSRWHFDAAGAMGRSDQRWNDLRDFGGSLAAAIAALPPEGGLVFVPIGRWNVSDGLVIDRSYVTLVGEGPGSVLQRSPNTEADLIRVTGSFFRMWDLSVDGALGGFDPGRAALVIDGSQNPQGSTFNYHLQNVWIRGGGRAGLRVRDALLLLAEGCRLDENGGPGLRIEASPASAGVTNHRFVGCTFNSNGDRGAELSGVTSATFSGCQFRSNRGGVGDYAGNGIEAVSCNALAIRDCHFQDADTPQRASQFVALDSCIGAQVDGCAFDGGTNAAKQPKRGVVFNNSAYSRLSSCVGKGLQLELAWFDFLSRDCSEFGNAESDRTAPADIVRVRVDAERFVGMSRRSLGLPSVLLEDDRPNAGDVTAGALLWHDGRLQVWDGSEWKDVALAP